MCLCVPLTKTFLNMTGMHGMVCGMECLHDLLFTLSFVTFACTHTCLWLWEGGLLASQTFSWASRTYSLLLVICLCGRRRGIHFCTFSFAERRRRAWRTGTGRDTLAFPHPACPLAWAGRALACRPTKQAGLSLPGVGKTLLYTTCPALHPPSLSSGLLLVFTFPHGGGRQASSSRPGPITCT